MPSRLVFVLTIALIAGVPLIAGLPKAAHADHCADAADQPAVCTVEAYGGLEGERLRPFDLNSAVQLQPGQVLEIELDAFDQNKRRFPKHRLAYDFDANECRTLADAEQTDIGRFKVAAGQASGRCKVWFWVPGDLNLEWGLDLQIAQLARAGYQTEEAQFVATRLYRALLHRDPDPQGLRDTSSAILRGDLDRRRDEILRSEEFLARSRGAHPSYTLEQLYLGILGRKPDDSAIRAFTRMVQRGQIGDVVRELLKSQEFEQILKKR